MGNSHTSPQPQGRVESEKLSDDDSFYDGEGNEEQFLKFVWPYGGRKVSIVGSFNNWEEEIPMIYHEEEKSFVIVLALSVGKHFFRFIVDNAPKTDPKQPILRDEHGKLMNSIEIKSEHEGKTNSEKSSDKEQNGNSLLFAMDDSDETDVEYGQKEQIFVVTKKVPAMLPPHLRYTPLNSTATSKTKLHRRTPSLQLDSPSIPVPLHVTVNHAYFSEIKNAHVSVFGITQRCKRKYTTIVIYRPNFQN